MSNNNNTDKCFSCNNNFSWRKNCVKCYINDKAFGIDLDKFVCYINPQDHKEFVCEKCLESKYKILGKMSGSRYADINYEQVANENVRAFSISFQKIKTL